MKPTKLPGLLSEKQHMKIILALAASRGENGFTEEEATKVCTWAEQCMMEHTVLQLLLEGKLVVNVENTDKSFDDISYTRNPNTYKNPIKQVSIR